MRTLFLLCTGGLQGPLADPLHRSTARITPRKSYRQEDFGGQRVQVKTLDGTKEGKEKDGINVQCWRQKAGAVGMRGELISELKREVVWRLETVRFGERRSHCKGNREFGEAWSGNAKFENRQMITNFDHTGSTQGAS